MRRPPPNSPLFPYTTLSRLGRGERHVPPADEQAALARLLEPGNHAQKRGLAAARRPEQRHERAARSEEHTSELQSRQYLVCRLLLEKKKIKSQSCIKIKHVT